MKKIIAIVLLLGVGLWGWIYYGPYGELNGVVEDKVVQENPGEAEKEPMDKPLVQETKDDEPEIVESDEPDGEKKSSGSQSSEPPKIEPDGEKKSSNSESSGAPKIEPEVPKTEVKKPSPQELEAQIIDKYSSQFLSLKNEFEGKIQALIGEAKSEYYGMSEEDRSDAKWSLGLKYLKKGKALEEACDSRFNKILDQMKTELKNHGLTDGGVKAAKEQYNKEKSARRKTLLSKAMGKD